MVQFKPDPDMKKELYILSKNDFRKACLDIFYLALSYKAG